MLWPFGKKKVAKTTPQLGEFEKLILEADKSPSDEIRQRLYREIDRLGFSQDSYYNIRTSLYTRLAQSGDAFAQCQLGDLAHTLKKPDEALHWYTLSANGGCTDAMYALGLWYSKSGNSEYSLYPGFGYDPQKSFTNYLRAAEGGHLKAMSSVAGMFADGEGTTCRLGKRTVLGL